MDLLGVTEMFGFIGCYGHGFIGCYGNVRGTDMEVSAAEVNLG